MSNVTDILDRFVILVEAEISGITKLPNPYDPESAPEIYLKNAYGLAYGAATPDPRNVNGDKMYFKREIVYMQIQEIAKVQTDQVGIKSQLDVMLENELLVIKAVCSDVNLTNGASSAVAIDTSFVDAEGPELLEGEDSGKKYFKTLTAFSVLYSESISS